MARKRKDAAVDRRKIFPTTADWHSAGNDDNDNDAGTDATVAAVSPLNED